MKILITSEVLSKRVKLLQTSTRWQARMRMRAWDIKCADHRLCRGRWPKANGLTGPRGRTLWLRLLLMQEILVKTSVLSLSRQAPSTCLQVLLTLPALGTEERPPHRGPIPDLRLNRRRLGLDRRLLQNEMLATRHSLLQHRSPKFRRSTKTMRRPMKAENPATRRFRSQLRIRHLQAQATQHSLDKRI